MFWDEDPPWMRVTIRRSKTDREGRGQKKLFEAYPTKHLCPIYAIRQWKEDRFQGVSDERSTDGLLPLFSKVDRWGNVWTKNINTNSMNTLIEKLFTVDTQAAQGSIHQPLYASGLGKLDGPGGWKSKGYNGMDRLA